MSDLISRSALLQSVPVNPKATGKTSWDWGVLYMKDIINNAPAVDAVEVVRCKDCIYYETGKDYLPYCNHADGGIDDYPREDDFCSYGERRSDDGR